MFTPLGANPTKWSNRLKQFVGKTTKWSKTLKNFVVNLSTNYLSVFDRFVRLALKGLTFINADHNFSKIVSSAQELSHNKTGLLAEVLYMINCFNCFATNTISD